MEEVCEVPAKYTGIKLKDYCDVCKNTVWHDYIEYKQEDNKIIKIPSYHKCLVCGHVRLLSDWKVKK